MSHRGLLHHLIITVSDMKRSSRFYGPVFRYLGYELGGHDERYEDWKRWELDTPHEISIVAGNPALKDVRHQRGAAGHHHHLAFCAANRADIDTFYKEILLPLEADGLCTIEDPPGECPEYDEGYYATFFSDPDGLKYEFVINPRHGPREGEAGGSAMKPVDPKSTRQAIGAPHLISNLVAPVTPPCMRLLVAMTALLIPVFTSCEKTTLPMPLPLPEFDRAVFESLSPHMATSEIDLDHCKKLRRVFRSVSVDKRPAKWQTYGYLSLYNGQTLIVRFTLFWDPGSGGAFKYDGANYRGYDQELFRSLNWQRIPDSIPKQIEALKQSEMSHNFSATIPLSESYNLPRK